MKIEDLKNYERYWRANRSIEQRILRMKAAEVSTTSHAGDGSQHQGAHDPMTAVDRRIDWCAAHDDEYRSNLYEMRKVDRAIASLPDPLEREILRLRYTDFRFGQQMSWKAVKEVLYGHMSVGKRTIYRLHDDAVRHFASLALDGT